MRVVAGCFVWLRGAPALLVDAQRRDDVAQRRVPHVQHAFALEHAGIKPKELPLLCSFVAGMRLGMLQAAAVCMFDFEVQLHTRASAFTVPPNMAFGANKRSSTDNVGALFICQYVAAC